MSRLIASSLTAIFTLGVATGLAIDNILDADRANQTPPTASMTNTAPTKDPSFDDSKLSCYGAIGHSLCSYRDQDVDPQDKIAAPDALRPNAPKPDPMVCKETNSGNEICWPKDSTPAHDQTTTCIESGNQTLCYSQPAPGPRL